MLAGAARACVGLGGAGTALWPGPPSWPGSSRSAPRVAGASWSWPSPRPQGDPGCGTCSSTALTSPSPHPPRPPCPVHRCPSLTTVRALSTGNLSPRCFAVKFREIKSVCPSKRDEKRICSELSALHFAWPDRSRSRRPCHCSWSTQPVSQSVTSHCNPTLGHNTPPWRPGWGCPRCNRRPGGGGRSDRPAATGGFCNQQGDTSFCGGTAFAASSHRPTNRSTIPKLMRLFGGMGLGLRFTCKQLNPSGSTLLHWLLHGTQQTSNKEPPNQVEHMRGPERASPHVH